jgi:hypothetical protein
MREYQVYIRLPIDSPDADDEQNVLRICDLLGTTGPPGLDGDDWEFGDESRDVEVDAEEEEA